MKLWSRLILKVLNNLNIKKKIIPFLVSFLGTILLSTCVYAADLNVAVLAVNGTETQKEKEINHTLPKELTADDIVDTAGLELDYDIDKGAYFVHGKVSLGAKETKTFKVRIRDIWQVDEEDVEKIKKEIDSSLERIQNTDYYETGKIKKESLLQRLDYVVNEQKRFADNIERRIDKFRTYAKEIDKIRGHAFSVAYWRSKPPSAENGNTVRFIIEVENSSKDSPKKIDAKHYLPSEVKPEHLVETQGFTVRYDVVTGTSYLIKEEELQPEEAKRYEIEIIDIWNIAQQEIDSLKDRARAAYKLLEPTKYVESAGYLVANIKKNLENVEVSQTKKRPVAKHISAFRVNTKRFESAEKDVEALEELLSAVRENLERSQLKNVLHKIRSLRTIADIAASIFKKPAVNTAWKIIASVVIFVGIITIIHFTLWGRRSKATKVEQEESTVEQTEEETEKEE